MTKLRESVAAALETKVRAAFTQGETEAGSSKTYDRVGVRNLPLKPREVWDRLVGILDGLPGIAPALPFQIQAVNDERMEITGALSDHAGETATVTIVTISYWVREQVGELKISLLWTPKERLDIPGLEQPPPEKTGAAMPGSRAISFLPQKPGRSFPQAPFLHGHP